VEECTNLSVDLLLPWNFRNGGLKDLLLGMYIMEHSKILE